MRKGILTFITVIMIASQFMGIAQVFALEKGAQFNVSLTVTTPDSTAPSQPMNLTATAVSSSRIDLAWTVSTDNVGVTGYKIYRDGIFLTNAGSNSYSDTGLTAQTSYDYTVSAFDAASNESLQSATATATTLSPSKNNGGGSSIMPPTIYDITGVPSKNAILVSWKTNRATTGELNWGTSFSYELGSRILLTPDANQSAYIDNLRPGTQYFFKITATDQFNLKTTVEGIMFQTIAGPDTEAPGNVTNFKVVGGDSNNKLSWNNPKDSDFQNVRIVRNEGFFPTDPNDGELIFEGNANTFTDTSVTNGTKYYYAIFAKDTSGNYSSGALAYGTPNKKVAGATTTPANPNVIENPLTHLPPAPSVDPKINGLTIGDFKFIQDGKEIKPSADGSLAIDGLKNLQVLLDYTKVPEILKTIAFTLTSPIDASKQFSFLLRINKDKTSYEANLGPLEEAGNYGMQISVVDHKNRGLKVIEGLLSASALGTAASQTRSKGAFLISIGLSKVLLSIIVLILLILFIYWLYKKDRKDRAVIEAFKKARLEATYIYEESLAHDLPKERSMAEDYERTGFKKPQKRKLL